MISPALTYHAFVGPNLITGVVYNEVHNDLHADRVTSITDGIPVSEIAVHWIYVLVATIQHKLSETRGEAHSAISYPMSARGLV